MAWCNLCVCWRACPVLSWACHVTWTCVCRFHVNAHLPRRHRSPQERGSNKMVIDSSLGQKNKTLREKKEGQRERERTRDEMRRDGISRTYCFSSCVLSRFFSFFFPFFGRDGGGGRGGGEGGGGREKGGREKERERRRESVICGDACAR